ncbi:hypothetical protein CTI14_06440, partial [Methylobacterium radiotolerans]
GRRPVKAVILAGGLGTRLSEETATRPKPMVEIGRFRPRRRGQRLIMHARRPSLRSRPAGRGDGR